jgi:hypothetical protein
MLVGNKARGLSYDETSYITMKKSDYVNKLSDFSIVSALVGGVVAGTLIFLFIVCKFNQKDTNRQTDHQYVQV